MINSKQELCDAIRGAGASADVVKAFSQVDRADFVRAFSPSECQADAYQDRALPIGFNQTISQPSLLALILDQLCGIKRKRVLEIGSGSGFMAALLSRLFGEVIAVERISALAGASAKLLKRLNYANVTVIEGDGSSALLEHAPYSAIVFSAAGAVDPLVHGQLDGGGVIIAPVGAVWDTQVLKLWRAKEGVLPFGKNYSMLKFVEEDFDYQEITKVRFVPLVEGIV